jgi:hypothetical protein
MAYHVLILQFVMHHKFGRTQLDNIHDTANLMALCKICHFAFDNKEWTFLPADITTWLQEAKAEVDGEAEVDREAEADGESEIDGDFIPRRNAQRDIEFRRWRLINDPDSEASRDESYASAFTDEPIKRWSGEPGVVILGNAAIPMIPMIDAELRNTLDTYMELLRIWVYYNRPCSKSDCQICNGGDDEDNEDDEGDNGQSDQKRRRMSRQGQQDGPSKPPPKSHQTGQSSTRKLRSGNRSIRTTTLGRSKVSMPTRKRNRSSQRKTSALYDKSVPYSHREGYTFAKCTANDMMRMWQAYRT